MKTLACTSWDEATQTCGAQAWVELPTILPPLSVDDATQIGAAILGVWAVAFTLKFVARYIWRG